ncbi:MAG: FCD domain-containing protein [Sciscionella sp.]
MPCSARKVSSDSKFGANPQSAVNSAKQPAPAAAAVADGELAESHAHWRELGTANMRFHEALAGLAGSERVDELMQDVLAELRLAFLAMDDPRRFHESYLARNQQVLARLRARDGPAAEALLADYLSDAEQQLVDAYS